MSRMAGCRDGCTLQRPQGLRICMSRRPMTNSPQVSSANAAPPEITMFGRKRFMGSGVGILRLSSCSDSCSKGHRYRVGKPRAHRPAVSRSMQRPTQAGYAEGFCGACGLHRVRRRRAGGARLARHQERILVGEGHLVALAPLAPLFVDRPPRRVRVRAARAGLPCTGSPPVRCTPILPVDD